MPSKSGPRTLPRCPTPGASVVPLILLAWCLEVWTTLPSPSRWLIRTIRLGYAIQFARRPPVFRGVHFTQVSLDNAPVLWAEIAVLLAKDAIKPVPPADMKSGFYSPYFTVPKKGARLGRPDCVPHRGARPVGVDLPEYAQAQDSGPTETLSEAPGAYGISHAARIAPYEAASTLAPRPGPEMGVIARYAPGPRDTELPSYPHPVVGPLIPEGRSARGIGTGVLNRAADKLSWQPPLVGEWWLHPQVVQLIWQHFGESQVLSDLPQAVVDTITSARAPSTRSLYALKWNLFVEWCSSRPEDTRSCSVRSVLSFLQEGLEQRLSPSTLKVHVAAIAAQHHAVEGCFLPQIPHVYSDCSLCQYKINPTTSDITIFVGDNSSCSVQNTNITKTQSSIIVTDLQPGNTYFFKINCSNVCCCGNFSTNPEPVSNLSVNSITVSSLNLSWILRNGISPYYRVAWDVNLLTTSQTFMQISQLAPGTKYTFNVTSVASDNRTEGRTVEISQNTISNAVQNLVVSAVSTSSVNLTWLPPNGTSNLFSYSVSISSPDQTLSTTSNNYQITQLQPGTLYNCSVRTLIIVANISGPSQFIQCNTKPLPVTNLTASPVGTTEMRLSWFYQRNNKSSYLYNVSVNGERWIQTSSETTQISVLNPGNSYTFTVQAVVNGMISEPVAISAFTDLGKASNISAVSTTQSIRVEWRPPAGTVSLYNVKILLNGTVLKTENRTNNTTVVFSDLLPGTAYSVIVTSISGPIKQDSDSVSNATLPTPPGELRTERSTNSLSISWARPLNMSTVSHYFLLQYSNSTLISSPVNCSQNYSSLTGLSAGVPYSITVRTVGALGYLSSPQSLTAYTKPSTAIPKLDNQGSNHSILVTWDHPVGGLDGYILNISSEGWSNYTVLNNTEHNHTFSQLKAATVYTVTLTTVNADFQETSLPVTMATYPNRPGEIKDVLKSNHSVWFQWAEAQNMTAGSFNYSLAYWSSYNTGLYLTSNNTFLVDGLRSGTSYNVSVTTVGPMGFQSDSVTHHVTTKPDPVQNLQVHSTTTHAISLVWTRVEGVPKYIVRLYSGKVKSNMTSLNNSVMIAVLLPSTLYNISVQSSTSDNTEGDAVWLQSCTDAAPVNEVTCTGPNLTVPMLSLSWSRPPGDTQTFEIKLFHSSEELEKNQTTNLNYNFYGLKYNTLYDAKLWTQGCGKQSTVKEISCRTGFTKPVTPNMTAVSVTDIQYNKFTVSLAQDIFKDTNGPVIHYGVLVSSGTDDCRGTKMDQCLLNTYEDWKAEQCNTFLAAVKNTTGSRSVQGQTIIIGDETMWNSYKNGELYAKDRYK
ncbi:receptor-type tyrosine-protein phosphatase eta-like [Chanodichthys erythropterus]|uniref:receptor-type tyrosine-protein phosphatase eta-like n=1 Tax=Chanodichthys erythropterus TaxID=933992 RepID=UPI00351F7F9E